ncbi:CapA family protein [Stackebrandtia albiflava]|nr:CapA family protein [Stackebrandtia albiflava]
MSSRSRFAVVGVILTLLAGCGGDPAGPSDDAPADAPSQTETAPEQPAPDGIATLAVAGDVHFAERTLDLLAEPDTAFGPVAELFTAADHAVVNLETPVTERGTAEPKEWLFRAPPAAFQAIRAAGIDLVSLGNNHALDYGRTGLADTLEAAASAGIPVVGAGPDRTAALSAHFVTLDGTRVAYLAFSQVWELWDTWMATPDRSGVAHVAHGDLVTAAVRAAGEAADVVVVLPHWGTEGESCPNAEQRDWAHRLADAGADAIIGTHAHRLQGDGYLGNTYVAYGLGNFLWWWNDADSNDTGVASLTLEDGRLVGAEVVPAHIDRTTGQPIPAVGAQAERISGEIARLRDCAGLTESPTSD